MKRKNDSLFHKISEENKTNSFATGSKNVLEPFEKYLKKNSLLKSKIQEIKALQAENTLPASKKVEQMLNVPFEYTYDFAISFNGSIPHKVNLTEKLTFIEHLKNEVKFNGVEKNFFNYLDYKKRRDSKKITISKIQPYKDQKHDLFLVYVTLIICSILWLWLGFKWIIGSVSFFISLIALGLILSFKLKKRRFNMFLDKKKKELKVIEKQMQIELNQLESIKN